MARRGRLLAGLAAVAAGAAGAAWYVVKQRERDGQAPCSVLLRDGAFELRHYPAMVVAETIQPGGREAAVANGYGLLADYVFAETRGGEALPLIMPVLAEDAGDGWRVRFVMAEDLAVADLPAPGPGVRLVPLPARRVIAVRFGGRAEDVVLVEKEAALRGWAETMQLVVAGAPAFAFYHSPARPGVLRRNEVLLRVH